MVKTNEDGGRKHKRSAFVPPAYFSDELTEIEEGAEDFPPDHVEEGRDDYPSDHFDEGHSLPAPIMKSTSRHFRVKLKSDPTNRSRQSAVTENTDGACFLTFYPGSMISSGLNTASGNPSGVPNEEVSEDGASVSVSGDSFVYTETDERSFLYALPDHLSVGSIASSHKRWTAKYGRRTSDEVSDRGSTHTDTEHSDSTETTRSFGIFVENDDEITAASEETIPSISSSSYARSAPSQPGVMRYLSNASSEESSMNHSFMPPPPDRRGVARIKSSEKSVATVGSMIRYFSKRSDHGSARLGRTGLKQMLQESADRLNLSLEGPSLNLAADAILEEGASKADPNPQKKKHRRNLSKSQFHDLCKVSERVLHEEPVIPADDNLLDYLDEGEQVFTHNRFGGSNQTLSVAWSVLYVVAQVVYFSYTVLSVLRNHVATGLFGPCVPYAKGFAALLNLNATLVLLPVSKYLMTWLQSRRNVRNLFAFDQAIVAHKIFGWAFIWCAMAHSILHVNTYSCFAAANDVDVVDFFGPSVAATIPHTYQGRFAFLLRHRVSLTGFGMLMCMSLAVAVLSCRRNNFERFWYLHHLFVVTLVLMCIHGTGSLISPTQTIYWLCFPLVVYLAPRLKRELFSSDAIVTHVETCGNILALTMIKPLGWEKRQKAGMYAMINIPAISRYQWHPFTISSAPFQQHVCFHISCTGDWTQTARELLIKDFNATIGAEMKTSIRLQGPFGAPSQGSRDFECVVLVGAGIGVTPMISTLYSLLHNPGRLKKAFFYWTVRDHSAFRLFNNVMEELYEQDIENRLDIRHFLTSGVEASQEDRGSMVFQLATQKVHQKTSVDIRLGHRTRTLLELGRPHWEAELSGIVREAHDDLSLDRVGIFFCGPDKMGAEIQATAAEVSKRQQVLLQFTKETF